MGKVYEHIDESIAAWIARQRLFFVASAPLSASGHVNCSPKGGDVLRVLGPNEMAYLDGAGSGIETVSHVRENSRLVIMLCAFAGPPRIMRFHGTATVVDPTHARFELLLPNFAGYPTVRTIIHLQVERISDSCGYGVPLMDYRQERTESLAYVRKSTHAALHSYLEKNNQKGIDGLPGLRPAQIERMVISRSS